MNATRGHNLKKKILKLVWQSYREKRRDWEILYWNTSNGAAGTAQACGILLKRGSKKEEVEGHLPRVHSCPQWCLFFMLLWYITNICVELTYHRLK